MPTGLGVIETALVGHGDQHRLIGVPAGGSRAPASQRTLAAGEHFFRRSEGKVVQHENDFLPIFAKLRRRVND